MSGVVIIGAGQAGFQTALSLRLEGYPGPVSLVDDEGRLPYARPPLSKAFLKGTATPESIEYRPAGFFAQQAIDFVSGDAAAAIDRGARVVRLASGREIPWTALVLATGAHVRTLPGADARVFYIRTVADSLGLRARLREGEELCGVGCGFIGLEAAAAARSMGMRVRVVAAEKRLMGRAVSPVISGWFAKLHEKHGVELKLETPVARLDDSMFAAADTIVVGIGVIPNIALAEAAGLEAFGGIVTDSFLRTKDPDIYAVGDCALHPNPYTGGMARLESVQNAADQAKAVAATISGKPKEYAQVPWFWTEQFEAKLQIAGIPREGDETEVQGDPDSGKFSVYSYREGVLQAVESVNKPADHIAARKALETRLRATQAIA